MRDQQYIRASAGSFPLFGILTILFAASWPAAAIAQAQNQAWGVVAFANVNVVHTKREVISKDQTVIVENGIISAVGSSDYLSIPQNATVIDGQGGYLLPGLCDMHVHFRKSTDKSFLADYLRAGITCVREMNGRPWLLQLRQEIESGTVVGPDLIIACPTIGNWSSPREGYSTPTTHDEAVRAVQRFADQGYDWIKFYSFVGPEAFAGIVAQAAKSKIPLGGHVPVQMQLGDVLSTDITSIEHLTGYVDACMTPESRALDQVDMRSVFHAGEIDQAQLDEVIRQTVNSGIWNCPTIIFFDQILPTDMAKEAWNQPHLREQGYRNRRLITKSLYDAGARLVIGTDSDGGNRLPASTIVDEMIALESAGIPKWAVLRMATTSPAELLGRSNQVGKISLGFRANLVLIEANPLEDLNHLRRVAAVVVGGKVIDVEPSQ